MHAEHQTTLLQQALHLGDLARDAGTGCADGDEAEVCDAFRRSSNKGCDVFLGAGGECLRWGCHGRVALRGAALVVFSSDGEVLCTNGWDRSKNVERNLCIESLRGGVTSYLTCTGGG